MNKNEEDFLTLCRQSIKNETLMPESNFFFEGGNSVSAIRLISNIQKKYQVTIGLEDIFCCPEIHKLYQLVQERTGNAKEEPKKETAPKTGDRFPLSAAQEGIWFEVNAGNHKSNIIGFALNLSGETDVTRLESALRQSINHFLPLRLAIRTDENNEPYQEVIDPPEFILDTDDVSEEPDKEEILSEYYNTFTKSEEFLDIENGITYNFVLVKCSEDEFVLYGSIHHIICDDSSVNLFIDFLERFYYSSAENEKTDNSFIRYCTEEKQYNPEVNADLGQIRLIDVNCPSKDAETGYTEFFLDNETVRRIAEFCSEHNLTESMFLQSAFALTLSRLTNEKHIPIGMPVSCRGTEYSDSFGMYVSMVLGIADCSDIETLLASVRETVLRQIENKGVPFHMIAEKYHLSYELRRAPFRFLYNYLEKIEPEQRDRKNIFRSFTYTEKFEQEIFLSLRREVPVN